MGDQDGLGLAAQTVHAIREDAAQIAGTVVELADGDRAARSLVGLLRAGHLGHRQTA